MGAKKKTVTKSSQRSKPPCKTLPKQPETLNSPRQSTSPQCKFPTLFPISHCNPPPASSLRPLKKEKVRMRLFRFMKKILRDCKDAPSSEAFLKIWRKKRNGKVGYMLKRYSTDLDPWLCKIYNVYQQKKHSGWLDLHALTETSPTTTDARYKQNPVLVTKSDQKSWNNRYIEHLMYYREIREFYLYYIDFLNEGKTDLTGRKLAEALGAQAREGLFEEFKFLYRRCEAMEERDTVEDGYELEVLNS